MTDDPREILKEAGVECADVEKWAAGYEGIEPDDIEWDDFVLGRAAILALARLVAEFKWFAEHDIRLVPKDEWHTPGEPNQAGGFAVERRAGFVLTHLHRRWSDREEKRRAAHPC